MMDADLARARLIAFAVPAGLLAGAYVSQYAFGLYPCEMCWWQRYAHFAALVPAILAFVIPPQRLWTALAGLAILASGLIGLFHAGVEYGWWDGITACSAMLSDEGSSALEQIMNTPLVRCDEPQWTLLGISLAGFNFLISVAGALAVFALLGRKGRV